MSDKPHYFGHRERLRRRVLDRGADTLADYELIEYLLYGARPRGDVKPTAKALFAEFGSLSGILAGERERLLKIPGIGESSIAVFRVAKEVAARQALEDARESTVISSWGKLLAYCRVKMAHEKTEQFRLLFLDKKNNLIADELQQRGTVDHTPVYPREVVKRALELGATAIILVHNHPSGDPTPSPADIEMTREIQSVAEKLGIIVHDHLVIARKGHASFKQLGLL
ncbi:MAG: DNA repair protein RadC [Kiloniellales bacterium]|nr:DNA repair protein RadC [Kiloniellales bacterium]